jgi:hypothetical protein
MDSSVKTPLSYTVNTSVLSNEAQPSDKESDSFRWLIKKRIDIPAHGMFQCATVMEYNHHNWKLCIYMSTVLKKMSHRKIINSV